MGISLQQEHRWLCGREPRESKTNGQLDRIVGAHGGGPQPSAHLHQAIGNCGPGLQGRGLRGGGAQEHQRASGLGKGAVLLRPSRVTDHRLELSPISEVACGVLGGEGRGCSTRRGGEGVCRGGVSKTDPGGVGATGRELKDEEGVAEGGNACKSPGSCQQQGQGGRSEVRDRDLQRKRSKN